VRAVAVLADRHVVTGGNDGRVLVWDLARRGMQIVQLSCSVTCLAARSFGPVRSDFVIAHGLSGFGFSLWSFMELTAPNGPHQRAHRERQALLANKVSQPRGLIARPPDGLPYLYACSRHEPAQRRLVPRRRGNESALKHLLVGQAGLPHDRDGPRSLCRRTWVAEADIKHRRALGMHDAQTRYSRRFRVKAQRPGTPRAASRGRRRTTGKAPVLVIARAGSSR